jgi:hypothetical protein
MPWALIPPPEWGGMILSPIAHLPSKVQPARAALALVERTRRGFVAPPPRIAAADTERQPFYVTS